MAIVTYDHVTKQFDATVAVKDLMIEVEDGEFLVLVGPSGPGASRPQAPRLDAANTHA